MPDGSQEFDRPQVKKAPSSYPELYDPMEELKVAEMGGAYIADLNLAHLMWAMRRQAIGSNEEGLEGDLMLAREKAAIDAGIIKMPDDPQQQLFDRLSKTVKATVDIHNQLGKAQETGYYMSAGETRGAYTLGENGLYRRSEPGEISLPRLGDDVDPDVQVGIRWQYPESIRFGDERDLLGLRKIIDNPKPGADPKIVAELSAMNNDERLAWLSKIKMRAPLEPFPALHISVEDWGVRGMRLNFLAPMDTLDPDRLSGFYPLRVGDAKEGDLEAEQFQKYGSSWQNGFLTPEKVNWAIESVRSSTSS
jgi:hypothetical protein